MASIAMVLASARIIESDFESLAAAANAAYASGLRAPGLAQVAAYLNKPGIGMSAEVVDDDDLDVQWRTIRQEVEAGRPVILNAPPSERGGKLTGSGTTLSWWDMLGRLTQTSAGLLPTILMVNGWE